MATWSKTSQRTNSPLNIQGLIALLGLFAGLCTIFALIVSAAEGWREHAQQSWPKATATIQQCSVDPYYPFRSDGSDTTWHIECQISYLVNDHKIETKIRSRSTSSIKSTELMNQWVSDHQRNDSIVVHYDPADHKNAVLIVTDMPYAGPHTPNNLKLLSIAAISCVVLLTIARWMRPSLPPASSSS